MLLKKVDMEGTAEVVVDIIITEVEILIVEEVVVTAILIKGILVLNQDLPQSMIKNFLHKIKRALSII
jgi:hypothetical protein